MNTNIKATNITLTPAISDYVDKHMAKVAKLVAGDSTVQCDIELARITGHQKGDIFKAEIHIVAAGKNVYASSEKEDLYTAVDDARNEIVRELNSHKQKKISLVRRSGIRVKAMMKGLWPWGSK